MNNKQIIGVLGILGIICSIFIFGITTRTFIKDVEYTLNSMNQELENKTNIIENQEKEIENLKELNKQLLEEKELLSVTSEYLEGKLYLNYLIGSLGHQKYLYDSGESIGSSIFIEELNELKFYKSELDDLSTRLLKIMPNGTIEYIPESINTKELVEDEIKAYNYLITGYNTILEVSE